MTNTIRNVDTNHIIFIEGNWYGNDFTNLTPPFDDNMAYSFHHYVGPSHQTSWLGQYTSMSQTYNIPLWVGEFGENSNHWAHKKVQLFENNDVNWTLWNYKHNGSVTAAVKVVVPNSFNFIIDYWNGSGPIPSASQAVTGLMDLAEAYKFDECVPNKGLIAGLSDPDFNSVSKPFTEHTVPGVIEAVDYDIGANGVAYNDNVYEDADKFGSNSEAWNNGWVYRNDGVDIEYSSDNTRSGLNIGWIEDGEWLKYTVWVPYSGSYNFSFNTASPNENGQLLLSIVGQPSSEVFQVINTNDWQEWSWSDPKPMDLISGNNTFQVRAITGRFNLKSINIEATGDNPISTKYLQWNFPNPFTYETTIVLNITHDVSGTLKIYNTAGHFVKRLYDSSFTPGNMVFDWKGNDQYNKAVSSGVYYFHLDTEQFSRSGKMLLIK
jgi:hypothetical protein